MKRLSILLLSLLFFACTDHGRNSGADGTLFSSNGTSNANVRGNTITIEWNLEGDSYEVVHNDQTMTVDEQRLIIDELEPETHHSFVIRSNNGNFTTVHAYVGKRISQPSIITSIAYDRSVEISWQILENAKSYNIYMSTNEYTDYELITTAINISSLKIEGLTNGTTYFFKVTANYKDINIDGALFNKIPKLFSADISPLSVLPGHTFGEITAATPNSELDKHVRIFKGYIKGNDIHFVWDSVVSATQYILYSSSTPDGTFKPLMVGSYNDVRIPLPIETTYYKVGAMFDNDDIFGSLSQYIEIVTKNNVLWTLEGGIESVYVNVKNYDLFKSIDLVCRGVEETDWFSATLTKNEMSAGPLVAMEYECKLIITHKDDIKSESISKYVDVYKQPDPNEKLSYYVWNKIVNIKWERTTNSETYDVLLKTNDGGIEVIATGLRVTEYTINNLLCSETYTAYVKIVNNDTYILSSPMQFILDANYCAQNPDGFYPEGKRKFTEITADVTGDVQYGYYIAANAVIDSNIYLFGGSYGLASNNLRVFDTDTYKWKLLKPTGVVPTSVVNATMTAFNGKLYLMTADKVMWEYDPGDGSNDGQWSSVTVPTAMTFVAGSSKLISDKDAMYLSGNGSIWKINVKDKYATCTKIITITGTSIIEIINNYLYAFTPGGNIHKYSLEKGTLTTLTGEKVDAYAGVTAFNDKILIDSGYSNKGLWIFNTNYDSFEKQTKDIPDLYGHIFRNVKGKIYIIGGSLGGTIFSIQMYTYEP